MQCHEFEERLQALLDERRPPQSDPVMLAHARQCLDCRLDLRAQELLWQGLGSPPALPGGFTERVVSQAVTFRAARQSPNGARTWIWGGALAAVAATTLLAFAVGRNRQRPQPNPGAKAGPGALVQGERLESRPVQNHQSDPGPPLAEQSANQVDPISPATVASTPSDMDPLLQYGEAIQSLASQVPQAVERLDEVEDATPGLRPVRTSFSLAIGTIRRTMPPPRKAKPAPKPAKRDSTWVWGGGVQLA